MEKRKLNLNDYKGSWAIHYNNEEEFKTVCKFMFIKIGKVGPVGLAHDPCNCICAPSIPWLAGHLHYNFIIFGNAINVGVDVRDMKPISEIDLMEDFNKVKINKKYKPEGVTEILGRD